MIYGLPTMVIYSYFFDHTVNTITQRESLRFFRRISTERLFNQATSQQAELQEASKYRLAAGRGFW